MNQSPIVVNNELERMNYYVEIIQTVGVVLSMREADSDCVLAVDMAHRCSSRGFILGYKC